MENERNTLMAMSAEINRMIAFYMRTDELTAMSRTCHEFYVSFWTKARAVLDETELNLELALCVGLTATRAS